MTYRSGGDIETRLFKCFIALAESIRHDARLWEVTIVMDRKI